MISNATRALCAVLSTISAAGLVIFADPAIAMGAGHHIAAATVVASAPTRVARG